MSSVAEKLLLEVGLEPALVTEIITWGHSKHVKAGQVIIHSDRSSVEIPFVLTGLLKVMRQSPAAEEIFLYYLEPGQLCALSVTCCMEANKTNHKVIAVEDTSVWMISAPLMDSWVSKYPAFRRFIFSSYQARFDELLATVDSIAFNKMDQRLYKYLLDTKQATGSFEIHKTHEQIAHELHTSRVVVSRLLKQLEQAGKIEQHRSKIEIM